MREVAFLAVLALAAGAQAPAARTRTVKDAAGRLEMTVPEGWDDVPLAEGELIHVCASHTGGHMVIVVREAAQADVDKQRDRYMQHDAEKYPGAEFQKIADPFFGYRMNDPVKNRVLLRGFLADGADGIVATISSRFQAYDTAYAAQTIAALASLRRVEAAPAAVPEAAGSAAGRRVFEKGGRFSFVQPAEWKPVEAGEGELLALGHKGSSTSATLRVVAEGDQDNPTLILLTLQNQWKKDYASASLTRATDPPALIAKGRKEGWVDYVVAFAAGGQGYTLRLAAREGVYEGFQPVADGLRASIVLVGDPYRTPEKLPTEVVREHKKTYVVHASAAEESAAASATAGEMGGFEKEWSKIAPAPARKGEPLHVLLATAGTFAETAHGFGEAPAAYDRLACVVVAVAPPAEREAAARWRGRLYAALAEAALHRDLAVAPPPWLLAGLTACMEAAGRTGEGPSAPNAALVPLVRAAATPPPLKDVLAYAYGDVIQGESPAPLAMAWAYTHLMLFGKGTLHGIYAKWARELPKATKSAPPFDVGKYTEADAELKKYIEREFPK